MSRRIMPSLPTVGKGIFGLTPRRSPHLCTTVLARLNVRVLASSRTPFPPTIPVCLVDRRSTQGSIALTFGPGPSQATSIRIRDGKVRLEREETVRGQVRFHVWVEIPPWAWNHLLQIAGILPTALPAFVLGPEPSPLPPAPRVPPLRYPLALDG